MSVILVPKLFFILFASVSVLNRESMRDHPPCDAHSVVGEIWRLLSILAFIDSKLNSSEMLTIRIGRDAFVCLKNVNEM